MSHQRILCQVTIVTLAITCSARMLYADGQQFSNECNSLPNQMALQSALSAATAAETSGLNNQMWGTIVDRDGVVCAVAFSGVNRGAQWPGTYSAQRRWRTPEPAAQMSAYVCVSAAAPGCVSAPKQAGPTVCA